MSAVYRVPEGLSVEGMHPNGIREIRAAVIEQAYQDYIDACKYLLMIQPEVTGKNVDKYREKQLKVLRNASASDGGAERRLQTKLLDANAMIIQCETFFRSQNFELFSDMVTGEALIEQAHKVIREWIHDERETTSMWIRPGQEMTPREKAKLHKRYVRWKKKNGL